MTQPGSLDYSRAQFYILNTQRRQVDYKSHNGNCFVVPTQNLNIVAFLEQLVAMVVAVAEVAINSPWNENRELEEVVLLE
jgi:hypothetical protein